MSRRFYGLDELSLASSLKRLAREHKLHPAALLVVGAVDLVRDAIDGAYYYATHGEVRKIRAEVEAKTPPYIQDDIKREEAGLPSKLEFDLTKPLNEQCKD